MESIRDTNNKQYNVILFSQSLELDVFDILKIPHLQSREEENDDCRRMTGILRLVQQNLERGEESCSVLDVTVVEVDPLFVVCKGQVTLRIMYKGRSKKKYGISQRQDRGRIQKYTFPNFPCFLDSDSSSKTLKYTKKEILSYYFP